MQEWENQFDELGWFGWFEKYRTTENPNPHIGIMESILGIKYQGKNIRLMNGFMEDIEMNWLCRAENEAGCTHTKFKSLLGHLCYVYEVDIKGVSWEGGVEILNEDTITFEGNAMIDALQAMKDEVGYVKPIEEQEEENGVNGTIQDRWKME